MSPPIVSPLLHSVSEVAGVLRCQRRTEFPASRWEFCDSYSEKDRGAIKLIQVSFIFFFSKMSATTRVNVSVVLHFSSTCAVC